MTKDELQRLADEDLMPLVAREDPLAFEVFYDRHARGRLLARLPDRRRARTAAEDVTQEALLSIWRSGARFDRARGSVRAWTLGIVRNRAIDTAPQGVRPLAQARLRRRGAPRAQRLARSSPTPRLFGARRHARSAARSQGLPDDQSRVIQLAYFGGFSHSEIAEMLNEPLGTIKGRMRLGMDKIRATLAEGW